MALKTTYKEYILEKLLLEYLHDGIVPTSEQLQEDLEAYQESTHPDLSLPKSRFIDFDVERGDNSSASHIHTVAETISDDVGVIVREIYNIAGKASKFHERWSFEIKRLASKAQKLNDKVDSLLLLGDHTAGYFSTVSDIFTDMNLVNTENTTAFVNVDEQSVTLNPGTAESNTIKRINTNNITDLDVAFYPLTKTSGVSVVDASTKTNLAQAFKTQETSWVSTIVAKKHKSMTCELKAHISKNKDIEVSRIAIDYTGNTSDKDVISAMYSKDGYTWYVVPTTAATQTLVSNMSWTFPLTEMRWIKFIFYKSAPDEIVNNQAKYHFSIRSIRLYGVTYYNDGGNVFESSSLYTLNTQGNLVGFNTAQLEVCECISKNTDIEYYLSASKDNSTWTSWINILPTQRDEVKYPKVISFSGASWKYNTTDDYRLSSSYDNNVLVTTFDSTVYDPDSIVTRDILQYKFKNTTFAAVNTAILVSADEDQDTISTSIALWRNVRNKTTYPDTYLVRDVPRGWGRKEQIYYCYFEILSSDGKLLDFGDRQCILDGQTVSGVVSVPAGIHRFETDSDNWFDISENYIETVGAGNTVLTEETLETVDPLYPHNHKLVIEGFPYASGFEGNQIYRGTDYSGEFYCTRTSLFDLENNIDTYNYFAVRGINKNDEAATLSTIVRYNPNDPNFANELFIVKWRAGQSGSEMYKYIKLKAVLSSESTNKTPSLAAYRIKLGL